MSGPDVRRPYRPSLVDQLVDRLARGPAGPVLTHLGLAVALVLAQVATLALGRVVGSGAGDAPIGSEVLAAVVFNGLFTAFLLGAIGVLDRKAVSALASTGPALRASPTEIDGYAYRLATMPPLAPLLAGLAAVAGVVVLERLGVAPAPYLVGLPDWAPFAVVFHVVDKASAFLLGVLVLHTVRQLRLVDAIHATRVEIDLYDLGPLRAFSSLTSATAASLVVGVYAWLAITPGMHADPFVVGFAVAVTLVAAVVFALPLYRIHRRMAREREAELGTVRRRLVDAFARLEDEHDTTALVRLEARISSLAVQDATLARIRTWPWRPEAAHAMVTVLVVPLALTVVGAVVGAP